MVTGILGWGVRSNHSLPGEQRKTAEGRFQGTNETRDEIRTQRLGAFDLIGDSDNILWIIMYNYCSYILCGYKKRIIRIPSNQPV